MSQTLEKTPVPSPAAMAAACSKLHTDLIGQLTMSELFTENLGSLAAAAAGKLPSPAAMAPTPFSQDKVSAALSGLAAAGSTSLGAIIGQDKSTLAAPVAAAVAAARKAGLWLPASVNDKALIARRQSALHRLMADAPGVTVGDIATPAAATAMSTSARTAVANARASGVLPADKTPPPIVGLANCQITFDTNDEDKDNDTHVLVSVIDANNILAAQISGDFVHFNDHSTHGPYSLQVLNPSSRADLERGHVTVHIDPNGHDTWRFNFELDLIFSDGMHLSGSETDIELTQDNQTLTTGLQGLIRDL